MSEPVPIGAAPSTRPAVRAEIARASAATGVDFGYLLGQARLESDLNPGARAGTSSAAGLYQFTNATWLQTIGRHGADHGYGWAAAAAANGKVADPMLREQILALRYDPRASALMAAELAGDNRANLVSTLGREPDSAELYLAHFLGADGAGRFLSALSVDPGRPAAELLPSAASANRAIFYGPGGEARSLGEVMTVIRSRLGTAMNGEGVAGGFDPAGWPGGFASSQGGAASQSASGLSAPAMPSMAETLASTFGGTGSAMPGHVRSAYAKLQAFGL